MSYVVQLRGDTVILPPAGQLAGRGVEFYSFDDAKRRLRQVAAAAVASAPGTQARILVPVVLVPRPDNEDDPQAVSVSAPRSTDCDSADRHLGFLSSSFIRAMPDEAFPALASLSGGEIHCFAVISRGDRQVKLALPQRAELAVAIRRFLARNGPTSNPVMASGPVGHGREESCAVPSPENSASHMTRYGELELNADRWGIAFETHALMPEGQALLACNSWAACIIVSETTADRLEPEDDVAVWGAIARHGAQTAEAFLVSLPSFGGSGTIEPIPPFHPAQPLIQHATSRAKTFQLADHQPEYWGNGQSHYRNYLAEQVPRIRWLDELRRKIVGDLAQQVVRTVEQSSRNDLKVKRWGGVAGGYVFVLNERGGRVGRLLEHPATEGRRDPGSGPCVHLLELANEADRAAATQALKQAGIEVQFDPAPGWLNVAVQPGSDGWLHVVWPSTIAGMELKPELARLHLASGALTVFVEQFAGPIELLLRRHGQRPSSVRLQTHPDDPERLFGVDLESAVAAARVSWRRPRKLRPHARALLPPAFAEQLESVWCPPEPRLEVPPGLYTESNKGSPPSYRNAGLSDNVAHTGGCRLCGSPCSPAPYCNDCRTDAERGLFGDRGLDEAWHPAVIWSLRTLAEIEFGGPPALQQLEEWPDDGANADLLMLCRMLTARWSRPDLGSDRKAHAWTDWLALAGLLHQGVRTSRGVTVMAKDGHLCRSLLERQIDDFLYDNGIEHEPEPDYPFHSERNTSGYRADWKLADGTFVEALGFTDNPDYMDKVQNKLNLAALSNIPVICITSADLPHLTSIFNAWLSPDQKRRESSELPPRPEWPQRKERTVSASGRNPTNDSARQARLERCQRAVELQDSGASRKEIADRLGTSAHGVKALLRDGRFYASPHSDRRRLDAARDAADERNRGLNRRQYRQMKMLTESKADETKRGEMPTCSSAKNITSKGTDTKIW